MQNKKRKVQNKKIKSNRIESQRETRQRTEKQRRAAPKTPSTNLNCAQQQHLHGHAPAALIRLSCLPPPSLTKHKNDFNSIGLVVHCSRARKTEWKSWPGTAQPEEGGRGGDRGGVAVKWREGEGELTVAMYRSLWRVCRVGLQWQNLTKYAINASL